MNLFEISALCSPIGGAVGAAVAAHQRSPSHPELTILVTCIMAGLVCGYFFYRGFMRLVTWKGGQRLSSWRAATLLGAGFASPYLAALFCFGIAKFIFYFSA